MNDEQRFIKYLESEGLFGEKEYFTIWIYFIDERKFIKNNQREFNNIISGIGNLKKDIFHKIEYSKFVKENANKFSIIDSEYVWDVEKEPENKRKYCDFMDIEVVENKYYRGDDEK